LDAVVRRVEKFDRHHDVPYLAGYSNDGKTIYIDRHMPRTMKYRGREIDTDRFLILHEEVENTLIDQLGLHYLHAHQTALRAEGDRSGEAQAGDRAPRTGAARTAQGYGAQEALRPVLLTKNGHRCALTRSRLRLII